jgi:hypothetical protein
MHATHLPTSILLFLLTTITLSHSDILLLNGDTFDTARQ